MSLQKFYAIADRLVAKIKFSQTPVPGFIMGLSGTDSIAAFYIIHDALLELKMDERLVGIHYVNAKRRKPTWFEEGVIPWMRERFTSATILVEEPLGGNQDQQRWSDLHLRALNSIDPVTKKITPLDDGKNFWTAGTINATEMYLGKYSILANSTSVQINQSLWKTDIMVGLQELDELTGVPEIVMESARIPDCFCGRDELAAHNLETIDEIIRHQIDPSQHDPEKLKMLIDYVRETKRVNGFKQRTPFIP